MSRDVSFFICLFCLPWCMRDDMTEKLLSQQFPRAMKLKKTTQFEATFSGGTREHAKHFLLVSKLNQGSQRRLGLAISKRLGNAVNRNRAKRMMREAFRTHPELFPAQSDVVVVGKAGLAQLKTLDVLAELKVLAQRRSTERRSTESRLSGSARRSAAGVPCA